jgi:hypothetical protein
MIDVLALLLFLSSLAGQPRPLPQERPQDPPPVVLDRRVAPQEWDVELLPDRILYRPYLADPRQSRSSTKVQFPLRTKDGNIKIENTLGGHRALALWTDPHDPHQEMQLSLEAAVFSRFDIQEGWDMDAADYRFGFPFVFRDGDLALKIHLWHLTSHLGDEFISRENRKRDSYHLDELSVGAALQLDPQWRAYLELGAGFYTGPETDSGRAQFGLEWVGPAWKGRIGPFAALDLQTRNEIGWGWNASVMGGIQIQPKNPGGANFRAFAEYYRGHDQQTQFKSQLEHYYAFGIAADF